MFYKVKEVQALPDYILQVYFVNGIVKNYDVLVHAGVGRKVADQTAFKALQELPGLYKLVKVDVGGYGISWNDDLDLSCNELYNGGELVTDKQTA